MKSSHKAIRELLVVVTELAEIVRDLDPSKAVTYERMADKLAATRKHLTQAEAFE